MAEAWREYEQAVVAALTRIDPNASVKWNQRIPDRRTGSPRQVDAWIEATVCSHKVKLVGSCKHLSSRVDASDIDHFLGEIAAVGAHTGIIFSRAGFAATAIQAAKAEGISCCLLIAGQSIQFQSPLAFRSFLVWPIVAMTVLKKSSSALSGTWSSLLEETITDSNPRRIMADQLSDLAKQWLDETLQEHGDWIGEKLSPVIRAKYVQFDDPETKRRILIEILVHIRLFESRQEAILADGVVNVTDESFHGEVHGPSIDMEGKHPGVGWLELFDSPPSTRPAWLTATMLPDLSPSALLERFGPRPLTDELASAAAESRFLNAKPYDLGQPAQPSNPAA